ncbi:hypothetical protein ACFQ7F_07745 [Streptomyces sp. NPDC056486]|uniref:hypothetical protein n=1 Tax=Streptomyces sp. NPDC056486 TaxID=3345835 RepID=UPI0036860ED9
MTNPTSRVRGTAKAPPADTSSSPTDPMGPGEQAVREVLGNNEAYRHLRTRAHGGASNALLAQLVLDTAKEADRLYARLRLQAAHARDRLNDALNCRRTAAFIPVSGVLNSCGHSTDLLAARTAQQLNQLGLVLDTYKASLPRTA